MILLDGKALAEEIKSEIKAAVDSLIESGKRPPHLVAVLVGEDPASKSYVGNKVKSCQQVGFKSTLIEKSSATTEEDLLSIIEELNDDDGVDGYIVQLPLPKHINEEKINLAINYRKDVDGFHPLNFGRMTLGLPAFLPATPQGILFFLERYKIETTGKKCVVVGRSNIVGLPASILLGQKRNVGNCTVTLVHSRTQNLKDEIRSADIVIAAIGKPYFITKEMIKTGAVVIDVGTNRIEDVSRKRGWRLVGDVDFPNVKDKCSYITPVPGGVGPMTVTSLLINTLKSAKKEIYD
ncbi:MAG: tetrahydrofolate dehydrogenase/cyclohydrolase catalytic domain-containing protein [Saprospiraceae bacterium]